MTSSDVFSLLLCFVLHGWSHCRACRPASKIFAGLVLWFWTGFGCHKNKGYGDAWWLLPFYCCSNLQMDQYPSPVHESGCRYLRSVVKFVHFLFCCFFSYRLLWGRTAGSNWTQCKTFYFVVFYVFCFKRYMCFFLYRKLSLKPMSVVFSKYIYSMSQVFREINIFFRKKKSSCEFWQVICIHISLHQVFVTVLFIFFVKKCFWILIVFTISLASELNMSFWEQVVNGIYCTDGVYTILLSPNWSATHIL